MWRGNPEQGRVERRFGGEWARRERREEACGRAFVEKAGVEDGAEKIPSA